MVRAEGDGAWLEGEGFRTGAPGWWVKVVDRSGKLATVPKLTAHLGGRMENIVVRDLERLELPREEAHRV